MSISQRRPSSFFAVGLSVAGSAVIVASLQAAVQQQATPPPQPQTQAPVQTTGLAAPPKYTCHLTGTVTSGTIPLPGAAVIIKSGPRIAAAGSTNADGKFSFNVTSGNVFQLTAEMNLFTSVQKDITIPGGPPCDVKADFDLALRPRTEPIVVPPAPAAEPAAGATPPAGQTTPPPAGATTGQVTPTTPATTGTPTTPVPGRATGAGPTVTRGFQALNVQADANGAAALDVNPPNLAAEAAAFMANANGIDASQSTQGVAISGTATQGFNVDMNAFNSRMNDIASGNLDPTQAQFAGGAGPGGAGGIGGGDPFGAGGDQGGPGAGRGGGGRGGGPGGGGGFQIGGRGARGQSPYSGTATYTFSGSALNSPTYILCYTPGCTPTSAPQPANSRNTFGGTIGGPVKIPGIYDDTNKRTNFQLNYTGGHNTSLFSQTTSVPTMAERAGDFSAAATPIINPATGLPFPGNQVPISAAAQTLLAYIPAPNQPGTATGAENYFRQAINPSESNSISLRLTQNLSPPVAAGGRGGGRGGGGGGGGRAGGGGTTPGARGGRPLTLMLNVQLQYRESNSQSQNVDPLLGGTSKSTSYTIPISLNVSKGRTTNTFSVNFAQTNSTTANNFVNLSTGNIDQQAGILGVSTSPLDFGVPSLQFGNGLNSLSDTSPSTRTDRRITTSYAYTRPIKKHVLHLGSDFRTDYSNARQLPNARGTFTFTGQYSGDAFSDFLLGMPTEATGLVCANGLVGSAISAVPINCNTILSEKAFDIYADDTWQKSGKLTFQLGIRYELNEPYHEVDGQISNLDVNSDFSAVSVVSPFAGQTLNGLFNGTYPTALIKTDTNNVGPRVGVAYRIARNNILRSSYSITYNPGSYATIARSLTQQPPFDSTITNIGTLTSPLNITNALTFNQNPLTSNTFAVDENYQLGLIQTWNATLSHDLSRNWTTIIGYTGTKGTDLDLLRDPNRTVSGVALTGVAPFTFESSGAHSIYNAMNVQLRRRLASGFSAGVNYTLSKSMDDASSLGSGQAAIAQNDKDLAAEWAPSNFDRRNVLATDFMWEIPFGVNRRWLDSGGFLAAIIGSWTFNGTYNWQSGTPLTVRCSNCTSSVLTGSSSSLRANLVPGQTIQLANATVTEFFNTAAFMLPAPGTFGDSPRNNFYGPGSHILNATLNRDLHLGGNRGLTLQLSASNLLNTVEWSSVNTTINSTQFGYVTAVRPLRAFTINLRFRF